MNGILELQWDGARDEDVVAIVDVNKNDISRRNNI